MPKVEYVREDEFDYALSHTKKEKYIMKHKKKYRKQIERKYETIGKAKEGV